MIEHKYEAAKIPVGVMIFITITGIIIYCNTYQKLNNLNQDRNENTICFILGEDKEDQQYYTLGEEYFRNNPEAKTQNIVKFIRSLEQMIQYLNNKKDGVYDRVEVLVHGNVWSGLSVKIMDGGERAYPKELLKAVLQDKLPKLNPGIIDSHTVVNVWGCGIGKNPLLNMGVQKIFEDTEGRRANVNLSSDFVIFKEIAASESPIMITASYWPYFYKRGYRPSESTIAQEMRSQYPELDMDWGNAFKHQNTIPDTNVFEESFHVPIQWIVTYEDKDQRPDVSSEENKMKWIKSQPLLMQKIEELSIPLEMYTWRVDKIIHKGEYGQKVYAIKAIGMSTVLCMIKPNPR